ncbi:MULTISPECIES: glycosyl hydrolase family 28-related protein [unclassified Gordonia (in: high G+C Gram-positive bacteria)]|uniref:glycosyl hydrolase family 28-related protein n=1 Tax=unclassified Gordonia (in: high G+C Gram-positive bacteria) TaxID=2657482 RepID=UPI000A49CF2F|nr:MULTISPECIES: glycosyl hydrolase family 28-related protein [unclassified Gordonia (in: high G+C Gram-positive bacteria)]
MSDITAYTKQQADQLLGGKYTKPSDGVPKSDLASGVQASLEKADAALRKTDADATYVKAITPEMFGAAGDGTTNDQAALQAMFDAAGGKTVWLAGTYAHSGILTISASGVTIDGPGTLLATAEQTSSVLVSGAYCTMRRVTIKMQSTTQRYTEYEKMKVRVTGDHFYADRITIDGSAASGVYLAAGWATFLGCVIKDTRADGIFTSEGSHDVTVLACTAINTGDDGFSVVSYPDGPVQRYTNVGCKVLNGQARGFSCVGGTDVTFASFYVNTCQAAALYVGGEGDGFANIARVSFVGGEIINANQNASTDHGALHITAWGTRSVTQVSFSGLTIRNTRSGASAQLRVIRYDNSTITDLLLSGVTLIDGPGTLVNLHQVTAAGNRIYLANVLRNGIDVTARQVFTSYGALTLDGASTKYVVFMASGGSAPVLPTAVGNVSVYRFKNTGDADATISTTSSQTIDGAATLTLSPGNAVDIESDGDNWRTF